MISLICSCGKKPSEINDMSFISGEGKCKDFYIDKTPVSVAEWSRFVKATNFKSQAEIFGDAGVFDFKTGTWGLVKGAYWKFPQGPDSATAISDHPVTQISWNDAQAYCKWSKKRLPSTVEFELAASSDSDRIYPWGDVFEENKKYKANFWQGSFPDKNLILDGFLTTSPIGYFGKNNLGLSDMGGNVWQWCQNASSEKPTEKLQRGGSFLCEPSVCHGFKIGNSSSSTAETSLMHIGFRCVRDVE